MSELTCAPICGPNAPGSGSVLPPPAGGSPVEVQGPLDVSIVGQGTNCNEPLYVLVCQDPEGFPQLEISDVAIGCALDQSGSAIGVVVLSRTVNEETGIQIAQKNAYLYDGSVIENYSGPFGPCGQKCQDQTPLGVTVTWG